MHSHRAAEALGVPCFNEMFSPMIPIPNPQGLGKKGGWVVETEKLKLSMLAGLHATQDGWELLTLTVSREITNWLRSTNAATGIVTSITS